MKFLEGITIEEQAIAAAFVFKPDQSEMLPDFFIGSRSGSGTESRQETQHRSFPNNGAMI